MTKRKLLKALKRLRQLPGGRAFFKYSGNKLRHFALSASNSTRVAQPSTIMLELSAHCNIHCTICPREYDYGQQMEKGFMSLTQAKHLIDQTWPYLDSIGLTGMGETFLYPHLEEVVDYIRAKNKGIVISASINAYAPKTEEYALRLKNKIDTIQVSIDGLNEVYNKIRVGSNFEKFSSNLRVLAGILKDSSTDLMLNMVVTQDNYFQMDQLLAFAKTIGIRYVNFTIFNLAAVTGIDASYYEFYQSAEFLEAKKALENAKKEFSGIETTFWETNPEKGFRNCPFPWTHFYICWNGEVAPCCAKPFPKELSFGNAFEKPLLEILNNQKYRSFRKLWQENKTHPFCSKCHFIDLPAMAR
ncbi:MAG: radical SAM protein [Bacteroidales bacterium]|nr:radical SAM protein [Bacteroidales bacterium]